MTREMALAVAFLKALWWMHKVHPFRYYDVPTRTYAMRRLRVRAGIGV